MVIIGCIDIINPLDPCMLCENCIQSWADKCHFGNSKEYIYQIYNEVI